MLEQPLLAGCISGRLVVDDGMRTIGQPEYTVGFASEHHTRVVVQDRELAIVRWVDIRFDRSQRAEPRWQRLRPLEILLDDELVVSVDGAENAGEPLIGQPSNMEPHPRAAGAEPLGGICAESGRGDREGHWR